MRLAAKMLLFGCTALTLVAQDDSSAQSLRGITSMDVVVEDVPGDVASQTNMSTQQIQTDVELRLRRAGIVIAKKSEAFLSVSLNAIPQQFSDGRMVGITTYSVFISFYQLVTVERAPQKFFAASTWHAQTLAYSNTGQVLEVCRGRVIPDLIDRFLNAYLSVNPKAANSN